MCIRDRFYSPSTNGFYHPKIHGKNIPVDAIEITDAQHQELLAAQTRGEIIKIENSIPIAAKREFSPDEVAQMRINELRRNLTNTDFKTLPDYQARSGKTDEEIAQIYSCLLYTSRCV